MGGGGAEAAGHRHHLDPAWREPDERRRSRGSDAALPRRARQGCSRRASTRRSPSSRRSSGSISTRRCATGIWSAWSSAPSSAATSSGSTWRARRYVDPTLELFRRCARRRPRDRHRPAGLPVSHRERHRVADAARAGDPHGQGRVSGAARRRLSEEGRRRRELLHAVHAAAGRRCAAGRARCCTSRPTTPRSPIGCGASSTQQQRAGVRLRVRDAVRHPARQQQRLAAGGQPLRVLISYGEFWFPWYMRRLAERPANVWFVVRTMFG